MAQRIKHLQWGSWVRSLGWEDPLEKEMATHSDILVWGIPRTEEPGRLQSMGPKSPWVGHNLATKPLPSGVLKIRSLKIQTLFQSKVLSFGSTQYFCQITEGKIIHYPLCALNILFRKRNWLNKQKFLYKEWVYGERVRSDIRLANMKCYSTF